MPNYHAQANNVQKLESTTEQQFVYKQRRPQDTVLYQVIADHLEWWLAEEKNLRFPHYVQREFVKFLECGIPEHGFLQTACDQCRARNIVPFSCKLRGFCSSCCTKRSLETTDHLTKLVLPSAPVRQWVFTFPFALRVWMARTPGLLNEVHAIVYKNLLDFYRAKGVKWGVGEADYGGLTFIQRFSSNLALNVHFHILVPEAAFVEAGEDVLPDPVCSTSKFFHYSAWYDLLVCRAQFSWGTELRNVTGTESFPRPHLCQSSCQTE